jgi:hypothetical protein
MPTTLTEDIMKRTAAIFILVLFLAGCAPHFAQEAQDTGRSKNEDIKRLLDLTVSDTLIDTYLEGFLNVFSDATLSGRNDISKEEMQALKGVVKEVLTEEYPNLMEKMVPLYDKYFTHDEIKQLIAFYEGPAGRKLLKIQPDLVRESMQLGQQWGISLAPLLEKRMKEKGLI